MEITIKSGNCDSEWEAVMDTYIFHTYDFHISRIVRNHFDKVRQDANLRGFGWIYFWQDRF